MAKGNPHGDTAKSKAMLQEIHLHWSPNATSFAFAAEPPARELSHLFVRFRFISRRLKDLNSFLQYFFFSTKPAILIATLDISYEARRRRH